MLEQSSTGRTCTRDAYAVRRDAHAEVEKLTADSILTPFHFSNSEESVLDRSDTSSAEPGAVTLRWSLLVVRVWLTVFHVRLRNLLECRHRG
jgi:hypothetical protein